MNCRLAVTHPRLTSIDRNLAPAFNSITNSIVHLLSGALDVRFHCKASLSGALHCCSYVQQQKTAAQYQHRCRLIYVHKCGVYAGHQQHRQPVRGAQLRSAHSVCSGGEPGQPHVIRAVGRVPLGDPLSPAALCASHVCHLIKRRGMQLSLTAGCEDWHKEPPA